jgi:thiazole synthase
MSAELMLTVNGEPRRIMAGASISELVTTLDLDPKKVAVERNGEIVPRSILSEALLADNDVLEIVHFVGGGDGDSWSVAGRTFRSRLIVGTGKYKDFEENAAAVEASGAEIVTVAVRRVNISDPKAPMLTDYIDPRKITYLPNTAGCFTAEDAIRTLRLAREAGGWDLVKLEVLGEARRSGQRKSWLARASCRWSIASTIRSRPSSWKKRAPSPSCRSGHRSARVLAFRIV